MHCCLTNFVLLKSSQRRPLKTWTHCLNDVLSIQIPTLKYFFHKWSIYNAQVIMQTTAVVIVGTLPIFLNKLSLSGQGVIISKESTEVILKSEFGSSVNPGPPVVSYWTEVSRYNDQGWGKEEARLKPRPGVIPEVQGFMHLTQAELSRRLFCNLIYNSQKLSYSPLGTLPISVRMLCILTESVLKYWISS